MLFFSQIIARISSNPCHYIAKICTCLNGSGIEIDSTQKCIEPKKNHFEPDLLHLSKKQSSRTSNYALGSHHVPGILKSDIY